MENLILVLIGLTAGTLSGFLGVGGATILIPALIYTFKLTQHNAQGTSLAALLLPVGLLAAIKYWQAGNVNIKFAVFMAVGFLIGGYIGAIFAQPMQDIMLRRIFALYLMIISIQLLISTK